MAASKRRGADRPHTGGRKPLGTAGAARVMSVKVATEMADAIEQRAAAESILVSDWIRRAFEDALARR